MVVFASIASILGRKLGMMDVGTGNEFTALFTLLAVLWLPLNGLRSPATAHLQRKPKVVLAAAAILVVQIGYAFAWVMASGGNSTVPELLGRAIIEFTPALLAVALLLGSVAESTIKGLLLVLGAVVVLPSLLLWAISPELAVIGRPERLSGVLLAPNSLGTVAALWGTAALAWGSEFRSRWMFLPALAAALLSDQRSAWLTLLVLAAVSLALTAVNAAPARWRGIVVLLGVASAFAIAQPLLDLFTRILDERTASTYSRLSLWEFLLSNQELWWPYGLGPRGIWNLWSNDYGLAESFFHAHNQILTSLVSGGVITAVGLFAIGVALCGHVRRSSSVIVLLGLAMVSAVESPFHVGGEGHLLAVAVFSYLTLAALLSGGVSQRAPNSQGSNS